VEEALRLAAEVPLEVAERATLLEERLRQLKLTIPAKFASDVETALNLIGAAINGAMANVRINMDSMRDEAAIGAIQARMARIE
jgi:formiminotetrahydrofolate cyclodeaminase